MIGLTKLNNNQLWAMTHLTNENLFSSLNNTQIKFIYHLALHIKNVLFDTEFTFCEENNIVTKIYNSVCAYSLQYDQPLMPSTKEVMYIITKILVRTNELKESYNSTEILYWN